MKKMISWKTFTAAFVAVLALCLACPAAFAASKPKYSADVPKSLMTPDKVQTESLGTLEFFDGMPLCDSRLPQFFPFSLFAPTPVRHHGYQAMVLLKRLVNQQSLGALEILCTYPPQVFRCLDQCFIRRFNEVVAIVRGPSLRPKRYSHLCQVFRSSNDPDSRLVLGVTQLSLNFFQ